MASDRVIDDVGSGLVLVDQRDQREPAPPANALRQDHATTSL
jgi:hypothetical protein